MTIQHQLTELQYSTDLRGPFALYIYLPNGYHTGKQWFAKNVRYPDEEISVAAARDRVEKAMADGAEVRICDGGDMLVFHAVGGVQLYPKPDIDFWSQVNHGGAA